jgi:hypothetical protein
MIPVIAAHNVIRNRTHVHFVAAGLDGTGMGARAIVAAVDEIGGRGHGGLD